MPLAGVATPLSTVWKGKVVLDLPGFGDVRRTVCELY